MAARGVILTAFISCAILLLPPAASTFFPHGPLHDLFNFPNHHNQQDADIFQAPKPVEEDQIGGDVLPGYSGGQGEVGSDQQSTPPEEGQQGGNVLPGYSGGQGGAGSDEQSTPPQPEEGQKGRDDLPSYSEGQVEVGSPPAQPGEEEPVIEPGPGKGPETGAHGPLQEGFYQQSCPQAEKIVNETIHKHFRKSPSFAPAIVRLFFHDCFVKGCDGSILLDTTPTGEEVEKKAFQNGPFVRGFDTIDDIKSQLEAECPGVVSCADILAFANRDSLVFTGVPSYNVAAGRRDGLASLAKNVEHDLPYPHSSAKDMIQLFERKGMSLEDLVLLIGAHSIGTAHCDVVSYRFRDPKKMKYIDRGYLTKMQILTFCLNNTQDLPFDPFSHHKMDSRFYNELLKKKSLLESDQNLALEPNAYNIMKKYVNDQNGWLTKFTSSIIKLGATEVLTGDQGEIRKQCRAVN